MALQLRKYLVSFVDVFVAGGLVCGCDGLEAVATYAATAESVVAPVA